MCLRIAAIAERYSLVTGRFCREFLRTAPAMPASRPRSPPPREVEDGLVRLRKVVVLTPALATLGIAVVPASALRPAIVVSIRVR